jgi:hypothetical protein
MIIGYFDGSSTHVGSRVATVCGFLADESVWCEFDDKWQAVLDKPNWPNRPRRFHAVECIHRTTDFAGWSFADCLAIFGDLATVLTNTRLLAIGSVCVVDDYFKLTDEEQEFLARGGLGGPLDFIFQYLISQIIVSTKQAGFDSVELVFDQEDAPTAERYHQLYDHMRIKHPHGDMLSGISFADSKKTLPLQAADMLAYTTYRWHLTRLFSNESEFAFPIIPNFLRLISGVEREGGTFNLEAMRLLIVQEKIKQINKAWKF